MELANIKQIKRKWKIIFLKNYIHILFVIIVGFILFDSLLNMFNYNKISYVLCFVISIIIILPLIMLKINLRIRAGNYLKIMEKGDVYSAHLQLIENANIMGGNNYFGGYAYRYVFHFKIKEKEVERYKKYAVVCININTDILSLKKEGNQISVPKDTIISVVEYKKKCIVLQNDCGFFDLAHDDSSILLFRHYV